MTAQQVLTALSAIRSPRPQDEYDLHGLVAEALEKHHGISTDRRKIDLGEPIKEVGDREISIRLHSGVSTTMTLRVKPLAK